MVVYPIFLIRFRIFAVQIKT